MANTMETGLKGRVNGSELFGRIADTTKDFEDLKHGHLLPHLEGKLEIERKIPWLNIPLTPSSKDVKGADVLSKLDDILIAGPNGEKFYENNPKLSSVLGEITDHEALTKIGSPTLNPSQLSTKAEKAYEQITQAKKNIADLGSQLRAANNGVLSDLGGYLTHHTTELRKAMMELRQPNLAGKKIADLAIGDESKGLLKLLLGVDLDHVVTHNEVNKAAGILHERVMTARGKVETLIQQQSTNLGMMQEHLDTKIADVERITGKARPSAAVIEAASANGGKVVSAIEKTWEEAEAHGINKKLTAAEHTGSGKWMRDAKANWVGGTLERNTEGVITKFEKGGLLNKGMRGGAVALGAFATGNAIYNMVAPGEDEAGKPKEVEWTAKSLQAAAGLGAIAGGLLLGKGAMGRMV